MSKAKRSANAKTKLSEAVAPVLFTEERVRRFWSKVKKDGPNDCWEWIGRINRKGYGAFHYPNGASAHRFAILLELGHIDKALVVDHLCRNRACVNSKHLRLVTTRENVLCGMGPAAIHARKTKCKNGHPFDKISKGVRSCRVCLRAAGRKRYHDNIVERRRRGRNFYQKYKKLKNPARKLTGDNLKEMFLMRAAGAIYKDIGQKYGVTAPYVEMLLNAKYTPKYLKRQHDILLKTTLTRGTP